MRNGISCMLMENFDMLCFVSLYRKRLVLEYVEKSIGSQGIWDGVEKEKGWYCAGWTN